MTVLSAVKRISAVMAVTTTLLLQGCLFNETGEEYQQPNSNTEPALKLNYNTNTAVNAYLTFADDSADISVRFGSKNFTFPDRSEMRLQGFGGFETDRVWKTSVLEDSRGIKTLRMGYYLITPDTSDIGAPEFHNFARDSRGNIYLTETAEALKSDLGESPFVQQSGALLFPAQVEVGESWVAGPTIVPMFYNFGSGTGWTVTLVDDNGTAPVSGTTGCVVLKYYRNTYAFYMFLKDGQGVVEWINSWEEDEQGNVLPINGWAIDDDGDYSSDIAYTNYGWSYDSSNPVGGLFQSIGLKVVDGEEANYDSSTTTPVNNSGYTFTRTIYSNPPSSSTYPELLELRLPYDNDGDSVDFTDSEWDQLSGDYYRPLIRVAHNGNTYIADESTGSFTVDKINYQLVGPSQLEFLGRGVLVNETDADDVLPFTGLISGLYLNADSTGLSNDFTILGLDENNRLPAATPGSGYRIYISYANLNEPLKELLELADETIAAYDTSGISWSGGCFGDRDTNGLCESLNVAFTLTIPENIEGELALYVSGEDADGVIKSASQKFYLPVTQPDTDATLTARVYDQFDDAIRGSLDDSGEFNTGYINATMSVAEGSQIVKYAFDMGDGTVISDSTPLGSYTYTNEGEYQIAMTVTDNLGNTDTAYRKVVISDTGNLIIRNIANDSGSGYFYIGIDNTDEPDGYYDVYRFVSLAKGEEVSFELPGDITYLVNIIQSGEVVYSTSTWLPKADEEVIEVDLDD